MIKEKVYIASGWFSREQVQVLKQIENTVALTAHAVYNPRKESIYKPAEGNHTGIVEQNISALREATVVVASTEGKDMGTLFECGYAAAIGVPIIYYYPHDSEFNIMLAATGMVVKTPEELLDALQDLSKYEVNNYTGGMV